MTLAEYLQESAGRPFVWGQLDCSLFACSWVLAAVGVDPAAAFRGRYHTAKGAARQIRKGGGDFLEIASRSMEAAGLTETVFPKAGDVGMVRVNNIQALAIKTATKWVAKSPVGLLMADMPFVRAWRIPCRLS